MADAILDTDVLLGIFLTRQDSLIKLLGFAVEGAFELVLPEYILDEMERVLRAPNSPARNCYDYTDDAIAAYRERLQCLNRLTGLPLPPIRPATRGRHADMILDLAVAAEVDYIVTNDPDLLSDRSIRVGWPDGSIIQMVTPDAFISVLKDTNPQILA
jgi:predicted nucleic acid-binding protein